MTWEQRWMRRLIKGFVWSAAYLFLAWLLFITPTWQVLALVIGCCIVDDLLDGLLPTDA